MPRIPENPSDLYAPATVKQLFSEMSKTYGVVNVISSFGFVRRWRRQCVDLAAIETDHDVVDLMTGMGECFPSIARRSRKIRGVDFCTEMCGRAKQTAERLGLPEECVIEEDVLETTLPPECADRIVCSFGLKTLDDEGTERLAAQVFRLLRPGGRYSFIEVSEPPGWLLRATYLPYIRLVVPVIGMVFAGGFCDYGKLGVYTERFGNSDRAVEIFRRAGLEAEPTSFFFGCATGILGGKP